MGCDEMPDDYWPGMKVWGTKVVDAKLVGVLQREVFQRKRAVESGRTR